MRRTFNDLRPILFLLASLVISCQSNEAETKPTEPETAVEEEPSFSQEEQEVIAQVEKLLTLVGNSDFEGLDAIISDKANLASAIIRDGESKNSVITIEEYFESQEGRERKPFYEPVNEYKILINKGQIAFVWADATLHTFGVPRTKNIDNFTLIREDGEWKFISIAFTNTQLPEEQKKFDLEVFGKSYAQVWCSQRPYFVASFFAEDGELTVNDGNTAKGTEAIANVAKSFMDAFPDMIVAMDSMVTKSGKTQFHWTLTGTNTGANGTGNKVKISGYEEWTLNEDGLIQVSEGYFDAEEYERQLNSQ